MTVLPEKLESRLRLAGILIGAGLLIEAITLSWAHPFAFMGFIFVSGTLVLAGILLFLWTVVSSS